ncbi:MAG: glycine--tRNA ligase subunit beta, partial [Rhodospirillales bacterium]|nr:glycine--tRNA ligase subunit beta [Acetobacter sp.]
MANLLLEIGVEEIPDSMIPGALRSLHDGFAAQLGGLNGTIELLDGTPRRLAMLVSGLSDKLPDANVLVSGPYLSAGAKAAEGFARKNGTTVEQLQRDQDAKGERYVYATTKIGEPALPLLQRVLPEIVQKIAWPKSMVWTGAGGMRFIRPLRWCVALLDDQVIPFALADVQTGNTTRGHRILGSPEPLPVTFANYVQVLRQNGVILSSDERRSRIQSQLGADVLPDDGLLQILVYLTEWPSVIRGSFDAAYLTLPREVLSTVMRHHQRQFSVLRTGGDGLAPHFVAVTNTDGDPDGLIRSGNERVLRARFNDARFFWDHDQTRPLSERVTDLSKVTWQAKLLGPFL